MAKPGKFTIRRHLPWLVLVGWVICTSSADAMTGNAWNGLREDYQEYYVAGVVDAWGQVEDLDKAQANRSKLGLGFEALTNCMRAKRMNYKQIGAIVRKYMREHPDTWGHVMSGNVLEAMAGACIVE